MLIPLTRAKFEQIIPLIATGPQYAYYWGKPKDVLRRLLISVVALISVLLLVQFIAGGSNELKLILGTSAGFYWLWAPVFWASRRNANCRKFAYSGFWRGRVLDVFLTEELIGKEKTVNQRGELVIIENRERWINLVLGDKTGFTAQVQAPLRRIHKVIAPGQIAELLILSRKSDLNRVDKITDAYIPAHNLWIGQYPYLRRDIFDQVSNRL
ncbi:MAG: phosphate ABC transporter permease [Prochloron sp. SP5CPC1]|nr:phosphate ABC transporter permease [Candidatus Paraprochloron terpiosi SP5CPC1]